MLKWTKGAYFFHVILLPQLGKGIVVVQQSSRDSPCLGKRPLNQDILSPISETIHEYGVFSRRSYNVNGCYLVKGLNPNHCLL